MNTANNKNFHYRTNSVKTNEQYFFKIQKTLFLVHFPNFFFLGGGVSKKSGCHAQLHKGFWHHAKISEKSNDPIPRKHPDRCPIS